MPVELLQCLQTSTIDRRWIKLLQFRFSHCFTSRVSGPRSYSFECLAPIKPEMPAASDFLDSSSDIGNFSRCPASFLSNHKQEALLSSHDSTIIHGPFRG